MFMFIFIITEREPRRLQSIEESNRAPETAVNEPLLQHRQQRECEDITQIQFNDTETTTTTTRP